MRRLGGEMLAQGNAGGTLVIANQRRRGTNSIRDLLAVLATLWALHAWNYALAETCQDVLKAKPTPITYQALYDIVAGHGLTKDEFESTSAFDKRISDILK